MGLFSAATFASAGGSTIGPATFLGRPYVQLARSSDLALGLAAASSERQRIPIGGSGSYVQPSDQSEQNGDPPQVVLPPGRPLSGGASATSHGHHAGRDERAENLRRHFSPVS